MKRLALIPVALIAALALVVVGTGASDDDNGGGAYDVRAIFENAFTVIPGLDVKIAGVRVGSVQSLDVTKDGKAAIILRIDTPGFQSFRTDATCTIRPQGLIGEKFVECQPTQPRRRDEPAPKELPVIPDGQPGAGQRLLPVTQTTRPVDIDLINNALRLPYRQRLGLIFTELGTAVAGRGGDLRAVFKALDPGLKELDKALAILAEQNRTLASLVDQSDQVLEPLARDRQRVQGFIEGADTTFSTQAQASAELEAALGKLPVFTKELQPTMRQIEALSDEAIPVLADLRAVAPQVSRFIAGLGPFSEAAIPATQSLGETAQTGGKALIASKGTIDQIGALTSQAKVPSADLRALTESLAKTGTFERLLSVLFYATTSQNGFDDLGYYQRAWPLTNQCADYQVDVTSCPTQQIGFGAQASAASTSNPAPARPPASATLALPGEITTPSRARTATRAQREQLRAVPAENAGAAQAGAEQSVADYLLGGDS